MPSSVKTLTMVPPQRRHSLPGAHAGFMVAANGGPASCSVWMSVIFTLAPFRRAEGTANRIARPGRFTAARVEPNEGKQSWRFLPYPCVSWPAQIPARAAQRGCGARWLLALTIFMVDRPVYPQGCTTFNAQQ